MATLTTTPNSVTLGPTPVTLTDTAQLTDIFFTVTGTLTFTLLGPGGTPVDIEKVTTSGNGTYTTPTGFTLPSSGTSTSPESFFAPSPSNILARLVGTSERLCCSPRFR